MNLFKIGMIHFVCVILILVYYLPRVSVNLLNNCTIEDMIKKENYPSETHVIITEDEYLLTVHRIPGPPNSIPVYLQHGLLSSSRDWLKNGKDKSLPYILSNHGYDVWMGNARGNTYSRRHKTLSTSDPRFWNFSWHEVGIYDVSATITYISNVTNNTMFYVGHSMGGSTFSVMASQRLNVAKNVRAMIGLVPAVYEYHIKHSLIRTVSKYWKQLQTSADTLGIHEFLAQNIIFDFIANKVCIVPAFRDTICSNYLFFFLGYNPDQLNYEKLPTYLSKIPAGTSVKLFCHWLQQMNVKSFQNFDYGPEINLKVYNSSEPPKYDLTKIEVPIAVFFSENDVIVTAEDVKYFYEQVPHKLGIYEVGNSFSHADFLWGINATELVYHKILDIFKSSKF